MKKREAMLRSINAPLSLAVMLDFRNYHFSNHQVLLSTPSFLQKWCRNVLWIYRYSIISKSSKGSFGWERWSWVAFLISNQTAAEYTGGDFARKEIKAALNLMAQANEQSVFADPQFVLMNSPNWNRREKRRLIQCQHGLQNFRPPLQRNCTQQSQPTMCTPVHGTNSFYIICPHRNLDMGNKMYHLLCQWLMEITYEGQNWSLR